MRDRKEYGRITGKHDMPRSYLITSRTGEYRRNRRHLVAMPTDDMISDSSDDDGPSSQDTAPASPVVTTRSKRRIVRPARYDA